MYLSIWVFEMKMSKISSLDIQQHSMNLSFLKFYSSPQFMFYLIHKIEANGLLLFCFEVHDETFVPYYHYLLLLDEQERAPWELSNQEKIEAAGRKKEEGNLLFKMGKYHRAGKKYEKVIWSALIDLMISFYCNFRYFWG